MSKISIRPETPSDHAAVHQLIAEVFEQTYGSGEKVAMLVERLREDRDYRPAISLVADQESRVAGYVLFSAVRLVNHPGISACALAPLGIYRSFQRQGIGSQLVISGLKACAEQGYQVVFVQGSLDYYPRFGFKPIASTRLHTVFKSDHDMVLELKPGVLSQASGLVNYPAPWELLK